MIPLEDLFTDIIGKAQRGLALSEEALASRAGVSTERLTALKNGHADEASIQNIARALGLGANALVDSARKAWRPEPSECAGLAQFNTTFEDMTVNAYLAWDAESREAVAFDTGADVRPLLNFAASQNLTIKLLFITHTHPDHVADLLRFIRETDATVFVGDREPRLENATPFTAGKTFAVGKLIIETRLTWGHALGGITYVVRGLERRVAIVGDAIFAGSMGGGAVSYADAMRTNRTEILTLPRETIICPGHGPLTTIEEELQHNPFFTGAAQTV